MKRSNRKIHRPAYNYFSNTHIASTTACHSCELTDQNHTHYYSHVNVSFAFYTYEGNETPHVCSYAVAQIFSFPPNISQLYRPANLPRLRFLCPRPENPKESQRKDSSDLKQSTRTRRSVSIYIPKYGVVESGAGSTWECSKPMHEAPGG